jgi:catechol 2,3-dioxygenase
MSNEEMVLPGGTTVGQVRLRVAGLDRMLAFYEGVLGLHVLERGAGKAALGTGHGTPLIRLEESRATGSVAPGGGLYHLALLVPDRPALAGALSSLTEHGWPVHGASDHGVSEAVYLEDPEGNGIEIYADRPRSSWRWSSGEVWMTSTPLDLRSLLKELDPSRPKATLPAETVVGHVHLHVTDLGAAERFYSGTVGLDVVQRGYPGALFMSAGRYHHHLGVNTWGARAAAPAGTPPTGLVDWQLLVPGSDARSALLERLEAAGHRAEPVDGSWRVEDPDGIGMLITDA